MKYEQYTKKELAEIIRELKEKLGEMKDVEQQVMATSEELKTPAIGVHRDAKGKYHLIEIGYDLEKNAAAIVTSTPLDTGDYAIASYKAKQFLIDKILNKAKGGKYV